MTLAAKFVWFHGAPLVAILGETGFASNITFLESAADDG
jgi:hypothetical protein